jgi:hypothetical protein
MADAKISELSSLTGANLQGVDLLPIVDSDANNDGTLTDKETKSISITELRKNIISVTDNGGDGSLSYDTGVISYTGPSASDTRAHFSGGTGVSISSGVISIGQSVGTGDNVQFNQVTAALVGNADTATSLANSRTIALDGDVSGSASFNGSQNITITATIADDSHSHVISDIDNLQSSLNAKQGNLTVDDTSEIDFSLTGQQISATLRTGSIDETKLDTSVNASLDLADSAQQPPSEGPFVDGDKTKLNGIEAGANVTDTDNVTAAGALMDSELTDLAGVKGVTISTLQPKPSEGPFVDGDKTKLDGIEASADVTDTANVTAAGALMDSEVTNLAAVKAFDGSDYATASQGTKADSALQSSALSNTTFSGNPQSSAAPTSGNHLTNKTYVDNEVAALVDGAPESLNTLNELAAALNDSPSQIDNILTVVGQKLAKASNLSDLDNATTARSNLGLGTAATTPSSNYAPAAGSSSITSVGTITTGTWQGTAIAAAYVGNLPTSKITSGTFADDRIASSSVTQHSGNITSVGTLTSLTLGGNISLTSSETEFKPTSVSGQDSNGKTLRLEAGDASGEDSQAGNLILNAGDRTGGSGGGTDGNVQIGLNHTNVVQITPNTTISGTLTVTGAATLNGGFGGTISSATITTLTSTTVNSDTIRGDDFTNSTPGGSVLIRGGNTASNDGHNGGNINIQGGQATDSEGGDDGNINIGTSNTKAVNIGASGKTTTINGTLSTPNDPLVKNDFGIASIRKVTSGEYNSITPKDENTFYVEVDGIAIFVDCEVGSGANPARNFTAILRDDDNVNTPNPNTLYPAVSIPHAGTGSTDSDDSPRTALGSGTWIGNVFASNLQNDSPLRRITVRLAPQSGSGDSTTHSTITVEKGGTLISNTDSTVSGDTVTDVVIELSGTEDVLLSYGTE